ncbi:sigma-54-dependent Fis family transcriptional regulator [bacterium]|nr:sigma-54-dependent Fis family transcriptional regulator [bacterium]
MPRVLIVDDEPAARVGMKRALAKGGYDLAEAKDGNEALSQIAALAPDLVFLDLNMPGLDGFGVLDRLNADEGPLPLVVVLTAYGSERIAVEAMKKGAYDYLAKPYEIEELRLVAQRALATRDLSRENAELKAELRARDGDGLGAMVGRSAAMRAVFDMIEKIAALDVAVPVTGESGTGKELVAREIHAGSARAKGPFVPVNCAALPGTLIESELFGHKKGAFTGAHGDRKGKFELAHGGTIFLDEVGDMSQDAQAKLLRVLENKTLEPLGSAASVEVDARVIAATHKDLRTLASEGIFRPDLFYRLNVVDVALPPLRERRDDIGLIVERVLSDLSRKHGRGPREVSPDALRALGVYPWPGNVRQLRNALERSFVLASGPRLELDDLPQEVREPAASPVPPSEEDASLSFAEAKRRAMRAFELEFIERKLREHRGNISKTAQVLGMHRQSLQQKLKELGIVVNRYKGD